MRRLTFVLDVLALCAAGALAENPAPERVPPYAWLEAHLPRYRELAAKPWPGPLPAVRKLSPGEAYPGAPALAAILTDLGDLPPGSAPAGDCYEGALVDGVKRFQGRHGLTPDGVVGPGTLAALNHPYRQRLAEIEKSLAWLAGLEAPAGEKLVIVNIAAFHLSAWRGGAHDRKAALSMRVVVGRAATSATPALGGEIATLVFRPYWYVPRRIVLQEMLPAYEKDPAYLARHELELCASNDDAAPAVAVTPDAIEKLRAGTLGVRQKPGPRNALGRVKFIFPNTESITLHDTPAKSLFVRDRRDFSHGCVRVHDPAALAEFLLEGMPGWDRPAIEKAMDGARTRVVPLEPRVPVWLLYATAIANPDGTLTFYEDVYGKGAPEGGPAPAGIPR